MEDVTPQQGKLDFASLSDADRLRLMTRLGKGELSPASLRRQSSVEAAAEAKSPTTAAAAPPPLLTQQRSFSLSRNIATRVHALNGSGGAPRSFKVDAFASSLSEEDRAAIVRDWVREHGRRAAWKNSPSNRALASNFYVFHHDAVNGPAIRDAWPPLGENGATSPPGLEFFCLHKHASESPRHRIGRADHFCVVLTDEVGRATYAHCAHYIEKTRESVVFAAAAGLPAPPPRVRSNDIVLCFVSALPHFALFEDILDTLLTLHTNVDTGGQLAWESHSSFTKHSSSSPRGDDDVPRTAIAECYVDFIVGELRVPKPSWRVHIRDGRARTRELHLETPPEMSLPAVEAECFETLFRYLSIGNVVHIVTTLIHEHSVLFVAAERGPLAKVAAAIRALIWPLDWPHAFSPVLPHHRLSILEAPMPFVAGTTLSNLGHPAKGSNGNGTVFDIIDKRKFTVVWLDANVVIGPASKLSKKARRGPVVAEIPFLLRSRLLRKLRAVVPSPKEHDPASLGQWRRGGKAKELRQNKRKNKSFKCGVVLTETQPDQIAGELAFHDGDVLEMLDEGRPGIELDERKLRRLGSDFALAEGGGAWSLCRLKRCVGWVRNSQLRKAGAPEAAAAAAAAVASKRVCDEIHVEVVHPRKRVKMCSREIDSALKMPRGEARDHIVRALREEKKLLVEEQRQGAGADTAAATAAAAAAAHGGGAQSVPSAAAKDAPLTANETPWQCEVRAAFLDVLVALLGSYRNGMPMTNDGPSRVIEFDIDEFIAHLPYECSDAKSQAFARESVVETQLAMLFMMEADSEAAYRSAPAAEGASAAWISMTGAEGVALFDAIVRYSRGGASTGGSSSTTTPAVPATVLRPLSPLANVTDPAIQSAVDSSRWEMGVHHMSVHDADGMPSAVGGERRRARIAAAELAWRSGHRVAREELQAQLPDDHCVSFFPPLESALFGEEDSATVGAEAPAALVNDAAMGAADEDAAAATSTDDGSLLSTPAKKKKDRNSLEVAAASGGPLPFGWASHANDDGRTYYYNALTRKTTWIFPKGVAIAGSALLASDGAAVLPPGWEAHVSDDGLTYFHHPLTRKTTWTLPSPSERGSENDHEAAAGVDLDAVDDDDESSSSDWSSDDDGIVGAWRGSITGPIIPEEAEARETEKTSTGEATRRPSIVESVMLTSRQPSRSRAALESPETLP